MSEFVSVLGTLLGAAVGGVVGFGSAYFIEKQRFKKEDEDKLYEKAYGELYSILVEAGRRYEPEGLKSKYPGTFLLRPKEVVQIEVIFATYYRLIPLSIHQAWTDALEKGPPAAGVREDERLILDLDSVFQAIKQQILKRGKMDSTR